MAGELKQGESHPAASSAASWIRGGNDTGGARRE